MSHSDNICNIVNEVVAEALGCSIAEVLPEKHLCYDLLADSLALLDILLALAERFRFEYKEDSLDCIENVKDLYSFINERLILAGETSNTDIQ